MSEKIGNHYYIRRKKSLMSDFERLKKKVKPLLLKKFKEKYSDEILEKSSSHYETFIHELPYIGGGKNSATTNLIGGASMLALIRAIEDYETNEYKIGHIVYETFEVMFFSRAKILRKIMGNVIKSRIGLKMLKKRYSNTKFNHFYGGWKRILVNNEGEDFDFGIDVIECGICTFYKNKDAEKYLPYLYLGDYPMFASLDISLKRNKTIGNGADSCDFRFYMNEKPIKSWPPEKLSEWSKK